VSLMDQRKEFVRLFQQPAVNRRELCRRFGISPKVGYKWLARADRHSGFPNHLMSDS
jgi:transposase-like protein